jgi:hypothetical protein
MLRSRMLTPGFKLYFGIFLFLLFGAVAIGISSEIQHFKTVKEALDYNGIIYTITGPVSLGWKGAVGNHIGYTVMLAGAIVSAFLAFVLIAFRDADPDAEAQLVKMDSVPLTKAPSGVNYLPILSAFALGVIGIGWISNKTLFYAGLGLLVCLIGTWTVRAWAERATGDDEVNFQIYHRIIDPVRVPVLAALLIGFVVFGLSRVILAAPNKNTSSIIFATAALLFFAGVMVIFLFPSFSRPLTVAFLVIAALAILGLGVWGLVHGPRAAEEHGGTTSGEVAPTEGGLAPVTAGVGS